MPPPGLLAMLPKPGVQTPHSPPGRNAIPHFPPPPAAVPPHDQNQQQEYTPSAPAAGPPEQNSQVSALLAMLSNQQR